MTTHLSATIVQLVCAFFSPHVSRDVLHPQVPSTFSVCEMSTADGLGVRMAYLDGLGWRFLDSSSEDVQRLLDAVGPSTLESEWTDDKGRTQRVRTPCGSYSDAVGCAKDHKKAVEALEALFPPKAAKEG